MHSSPSRVRFYLQSVIPAHTVSRMECHLSLIRKPVTRRDRRSLLTLIIIISIHSL